MEEDSDFSCNLRVKIVNRLINNKFEYKLKSSKSDQLKLFVQGKVNILIVSEINCARPPSL